jgi:serine/threonine-protein phosphatase 4 regulatory subunit 1
VDIHHQPPSPHPESPPRPAQADTGFSHAFPSFSLPPAVATASIQPLPTGDDGSSSHIETIISSPSPTDSPESPLNLRSLPFAPIARPGVLRRAVSDFDARSRITAPGLTRSLSITADLDKSPKRSTTVADIPSPVSPTSGQGDADLIRVRKSPRRSPLVEPITPRLPTPPPLSDTPSDIPAPPDTPALPSSLIWRGDLDLDHMGEVNLVDEGDILPNVDIQMDVTFDDEGLNTLERIFLLSKSEYPFHRAYVARVLGDLLADVDPCESVEYVLPLLSGFSMDEDETVKEGFASELHRILWYFFSTCRLVEEERAEEEIPESMGIEHDPSTETVTITSNGVEVVETPTQEDVESVPVYEETRRASASSLAIPDRASSVGSSLTQRTNTGFSVSTEGTTPASVYSETPSEAGTAFSPSAWVNPYAEDADPEKGWAKDSGPLVKAPTLPVNFFTPLLGALLLNANPMISDSVRSGLVSIVGRMRGKAELDAERWGLAAVGPEKDERRTFASQSGPHCHDLRPFSQQSKDLLEKELINGIIVGMGHLSTDLPESLFDIAEDDGAEEEGARLFLDQLLAEATAGRATSMNLIGAICEYFHGEECVDKGFLGEVLRCWDGDVAVRAEGAVALSCIAKIAPVEWVDPMVSHSIPYGSEIADEVQIDLFDHLANDETEHVRQSICLSLPALCRRIETPEVKKEFAVRAVIALSASGEDVKCALLEMMGEVIHSFESDAMGPPIELLKVYMEDQGMQGPDADYDIVASFNVSYLL